MPLVDSHGDLQGIQLLNGAVPADSIALGNFVTLHVKASPGASGSNLVQTNWQTGIAEYYAVPPNYREAQKAFQRAAGVNPNFQAATLFANLAAQKTSSSGNGTSNSGRPTQAASSRTIFGIPLSLVTLFEIAIAFLVLIILFLTVILRFGRARSKRKEENATKT
jgi:hypothetical protein